MWLELFEKYWWLSALTLPMLAFILWVVCKRIRGESVKTVHEGSRLKAASRILLLITVLNFGIWGVGTAALHGDAVSGKIADGRYFVKYKSRYTEVSRATFTYSYIHTMSVIISFPVAIAMFAVAETIDRKRKKTEAKDSD